MFRNLTMLKELNLETNEVAIADFAHLPPNLVSLNMRFNKVYFLLRSRNDVIAVIPMEYFAILHCL